jgi:hypothetical protein
MRRKSTSVVGLMPRGFLRRQDGVLRGNLLSLTRGEYDDVSRCMTVLKDSQLEQIARFGEEIVFILPKTP